MTRHRSYGREAINNCTTPMTVPDRENLNMRSWRKIENQGRQLVKLYLPRMSERNGPICCYRVFLVKLAPQKTLADLPPPEEIPVYSYSYVHSSQSGGAYLAEMFDSNFLLSDVFLGDGESFNKSTACEHCIGLKPRPIPPLLHFVPEVQTPAILNLTSATETPQTISSPTVFEETTTAEPTAAPVAQPLGNMLRRRREDAFAGKEGELVPYPPHDGFLDETANYTAFIEIVGE